MRKIVQLKQCLLFALALIGAPGISAAQQPSALKRLEGGTPVLEVVKAWHKALLVGDFDAYLRTTSTTFVPGQTSPYAFGQLRRYIPQEAWTRGEQKEDDGGTTVLVAGCNGPFVFATVLAVEQIEGKPLVKATGGFSRIPTSPGVLTCPSRADALVCEVNADCPTGSSCRSKKGGGTECRASPP